MFGCLMFREGKYFDFFNVYVELIMQGGKVLLEFIGVLVDVLEKVLVYVENIDFIECQVDEIIYSILVQFYILFIMLFDCDEIYQLINGMDDILDIIQDVVELMLFYDIYCIFFEVK